MSLFPNPKYFSKKELSMPLQYLISTKLNRPILPVDFVHRKNILDSLIRYNPCNLTLVVAQAGFGKTTLVISGWRRPFEKK
jgi:ATP/maltotriose-dependent transcriptional regulator MalT